MYLTVTDAAEGADLVRSLQRHGLTAGLVPSDGQWQVEVRSPREDARTFLADIGVALAAWNEGHRGDHGDRHRHRVSR